MSARVASRFIAVFILAVVLTIVIDQNHIRLGSAGKEAFVAAATQRFDRYYGQPRPFSILPAILCVAACAGAYGLLALGAYKVIRLLGFADDLQLVRPRVVRESPVRPAEFAIVASLVTVVTIASWIFARSTYPFSPLIALVSQSIYVICFWLRYNWARWATIILSILTLFLALEDLRYIIEVPVALFLLYWLST